MYLTSYILTLLVFVSLKVSYQYTQTSTQLHIFLLQGLAAQFLAESSNCKTYMSKVVMCPLYCREQFKLR